MQYAICIAQFDQISTHRFFWDWQARLKGPYPLHYVEKPCQHSAKGLDHTTPPHSEKDVCTAELVTHAKNGVGFPR